MWIDEVGRGRTQRQFSSQIPTSRKVWNLTSCWNSQYENVQTSSQMKLVNTSILVYISSYFIIHIREALLISKVLILKLYKYLFVWYSLEYVLGCWLLAWSYFFLFRAIVYYIYKFVCKSPPHMLCW